MPNDKDTLEEIKKALEAATPGPWEVEYAIITSVKAKDRLEIIGTYIKRCDALLIANAPKWLRYLLQLAEQQQAEIEAMRLSRDFEIKESNKAKHLLQQSREENKRLKNEIKSHGPEGRNYTNAQYVELRLENERLRGELAAKDKVLEWYADESAEIARAYYFGQTKLAIGQRARDILSRYPHTPERGEENDERD